MPLYEYRCEMCGGMSSFFTKSINTSVEPVCAHCQATHMRRIISTVATGKSGGRTGDNFPSGVGGPPLDYYRDPRNIGRHVEESFSRHGVDMPESVRDTIRAAREGGLPKGLDV